MASSEEILFFRLSSAIEAIVFYVVIFNVLPTVYRERHRSSIYQRISILFLLILLIIAIRFYDFMEARLFRSMTKEQKLRFLIYVLSTVESIFDYSLVALNLETLLELSLVPLKEVNLWMLFIGLAGGVPISFLFLYVTVWETSKHFSTVFSLAVIESVIPGLGVLILLLLIFFYARRKKSVMSEDCLTRVKALVLINITSLLGMCLHLLLFCLSASVILDDLVDALLKLSVCVSFLVVQPGHWTASLLLSSLNIEQPVSQPDLNPIVM